MTRRRKTRAPLSPARRRASNALLAIGYSLAVGAGAKLVPTYTERRRRRFLVFQAGTGAVVAGLVLRRRRIPAALNAAILAGSAASGWATGRHRS